MSLSSQQFESLALEHLDLLYRIARRMTRSTQVAEDLVQETYLRAFRSRETFKLGEYGIRPWLVRILQNIHYSQLQKDRREPASAEVSILNDARPTGDGNYVPANPKDPQAMDQRLVSALNDLQDEYRIVLVLWAVEEMSYKEIAEACEIPLGTVMSRLHRARQRLGERLGDLAADRGLNRE